jgi:hypothetical protein
MSGYLEVKYLSTHLEVRCLSKRVQIRYLSSLEVTISVQICPLAEQQFISIKYLLAIRTEEDCHNYRVANSIHKYLDPESGNEACINYSITGSQYEKKGI